MKGAIPENLNGDLDLFSGAKSKRLISRAIIQKELGLFSVHEGKAKG